STATAVKTVPFAVTRAAATSPKSRSPTVWRLSAPSALVMSSSLVMESFYPTHTRLHDTRFVRFAISRSPLPIVARRRNGGQAAVTVVRQSGRRGGRAAAAHRVRRIWRWQRPTTRQQFIEPQEATQ